jgi:hypothetical protein
MGYAPLAGALCRLIFRPCDILLKCIYRLLWGQLSSLQCIYATLHWEGGDRSRWSSSSGGGTIVRNWRQCWLAFGAYDQRQTLVLAS